jgi:hypothetical protein
MTWHCVGEVPQQSAADRCARAYSRVTSRKRLPLKPPYLLSVCMWW